MVQDQVDQGKLANEQGLLSELQVYYALQCLKGAVRGFRYARLASPKEDTHGVDIVIYTDLGPAFLQVKSSPNGVRKGRKGITHFLIRYTAYEVINGNVSHEKLMKDLPDVIRCLYNRIKKFRARYKLEVESTGVQVA